MKKILLPLVCFLFCLTSGNAQEEKLFEGEIVYETFEHYSDALKNQFNFSFSDGVHKIRLITKGSKMHMIDETTHIHAIADDAGPSYTEYCEWTKKGFVRRKDLIDAQCMLSPRDMQMKIVNNVLTFPLLSNTFSQKTITKTILDIPCTLYEGDICRNVGNDQTYSIKAYVSNLAAPAGYKYNLYGLEIPGIALQWRMKFDIGHVKGVVGFVKGGEHSMYIEADVTEIKPRKVDDKEFEIPSDYNIIDASNGFAVLKYQSEVKKQLKKQGIIGGNNHDKATGVHYKTDEEWEF